MSAIRTAAVTSNVQGQAAGPEAHLLIPRLLATLGGNPSKRYLEELAH